MKFYTDLLSRNSSLCVNYYFNHPLEEPVYTQEYIANYLCKGHQDGPPPPPTPHLLFPSMGKICFPGLCILEVLIHYFVSLRYPQHIW